eukprot:3433470-Rhodomonas_salina.1
MQSKGEVAFDGLLDRPGLPNSRQRKRVAVGGAPIARHDVGRREASRDGRASRRAAVLYTGRTSSRKSTAVHHTVP